MNKAAKEFAAIINKHKLTYEQANDAMKQARQDCKLTRSKRPPVQPKVPSFDSIKKLFDLISTKSSKDKLMMNVLLYMGIRSCELVRISIEDIDLSPGQEKLFAHRKGGHDKYLSIPKILVEQLRLYLDNNTKNVFLFESRYHKAYTERAIRKKLQNYREEANLGSELTAHSFRRTLCTYLANEGWNEQQLMLVSGHDDSKSLKHYILKNPEMIRNQYNQAVNNLSLRT